MVIGEQLAAHQQHLQQQTKILVATQQQQHRLAEAVSVPQQAHHCRNSKTLSSTTAASEKIAISSNLTGNSNSSLQNIQSKSISFNNNHVSTLQNANTVISKSLSTPGTIAANNSSSLASNSNFSNITNIDLNNSNGQVTNSPQNACIGVSNTSLNINSNNSNSSNNNLVVALVGGGTSAIAAKHQLEQLNTMREALFSQDGWGCQHVNQDTNWEVPSSPEPTNKDPTGATAMWKPTINNGTDLWETNLRNGGQPPTQPVQKTPWGHTPTSNLGGTWGEDDDGTDSSSVWAGGSAGNASSTGGVSNVGSGNGGPAGNGTQWGQTTIGVGVGGGNVTSGPNSGNVGGAGNGVTTSSGGVNIAVGAAANVGGGVGSAGNGWGDPRDMRGGSMSGGPMDMRSVDSMRAASAGDPRDLRILDARDPIRGDPRGISGRLNGTSEMWGQHHAISAHNPMQSITKIVGPGGGAVVAAGGGVGSIGAGGLNPAAAAAANNVPGQWGTSQPVVGPKDITSLTGGKQVTGWDEPSPPPQRRNIPNYDDGTSVWSQQSRVPGGGSHWKDISEPMNRHIIRNTLGSQNTPNVGSSTGLVGPQGGGIGAPGSVGVATGNPNNPMLNVGQQGRLTNIGPTGVGVGLGQHKPDNSMWVHPSNTAVGGRSVAASWGDDNSHNLGSGTSGVGANWVDDKTNASVGQIGANVGSGNSWNDASACWNKNQNKMSSGAGTTGWGTAAAVANTTVGANDANDLSSDWSATAHGGMVNNKQQQKMGNSGVSLSSIGGNINTDIIKQSKQYRILVDNGFKKDDVERALISANMNIEEAAEILRNNPNSIVMESWRRHDESLGSYVDHANSTAASGFPGRYPATPTQQTMTFPPNSILNNMGGTAGNNPNLAALNAMQPMQVQKYLNQGPHGGGTGGAAGSQAVNNANAVVFGQGTASVAAVAAVSATTNSNNQPSAQQLRMLVQQIQLAVHSGYLSSQILNQPLAPATLLLLNQLLTNIKHLQGAQQSLGRGNNANSLHINAIAKLKQQIQNLQNQINAQQAMYIKQQQTMQHQQNAQQPQHPSSVSAVTHVNPNTEYLRGPHDAISALQGNFGEINLNKAGGYPATSNQQSRLNQWKLPVLDKDLTTDSTTDFSRAPGTTKSLAGPTSVNNMSGPLGLQTDGTWSTGRNVGDGWPDTNVSAASSSGASNENENKDWSVQEFEPGKPWKGSQIKNIEDDPSITPGSVARSPLSINPTPKEADIFSNASKTSPTDLPPLSLSSSTWSFNPSASNPSFPSWSDNSQQCATSELWATPTAMAKPARGPPPGLMGGNKNAVGVGGMVNPNTVLNASPSNGWLAAATGRNGVGGGTNSGVLLQNSSGNSSWTSSGSISGGNACSANSNWNSNWLLLKNLTAQIDGSTLRTLCMQHGPPMTFHLYLNQGIALCKYATREEANKAQMTLNNCVLGNTTICAESPSEGEVQNILQHLPQLQQQQHLQQNQPLQITTPAVVTANANATGSNGNSSCNNGSSNQSTAGGVTANCGNNVGAVLNGNATNTTNNNATTAGNVSSNSTQSQNIAVVAANGAGGSNGSGTVGNANSMPGNSGNTSGSVAPTPNTNPATVANWRQSQQQQNQTRPSGRESDFDYISKYVCSIVDD